MAGVSGFILDGRWIDGLGHLSVGHVGMRVRRIFCTADGIPDWLYHRIVEYATREQAQQAVNTLSNQNLMGRLVYVREVSFYALSRNPAKLRCGRVLTFTTTKDREAEPRFTGPPAARGGYDGPPSGRGGYGSGAGYGGPPSSGGGRQIFVNNVCIPIRLVPSMFLVIC